MLKKIIKICKHPSLLLLKLDAYKIIRLSDKKFLEYRFLQEFGYKLNLENPKTFNEKLQWLKLYDRNPLYTNLVDKYIVKEYVVKNIGEEYIIPTLGIYDKFEEINFDLLPDKFVMKCTHDSGGLVICKDKKKLDIIEAQKKLVKNLKINYYYKGREWPYKDVKPRIIIEKYMEDKKFKEIRDYKIMCFNGEPKMLFICNDRFTDGLHVTFFDLDWNKLPFERHYPSSNKEIEKPINFDKMLEFSKKLSKNIPFVRVDWYEINGKLYFGELTFYPGSGYEEFKPFEWDEKIGEMINLKKLG